MEQISVMSYTPTFQIIYNNYNIIITIKLSEMINTENDICYVYHHLFNNDNVTHAITGIVMGDRTYAHNVRTITCLSKKR